MVVIDISVNHIFHVTAPTIKPLTEVLYVWKKVLYVCIFGCNIAATLQGTCKHSYTWKNSKCLQAAFKMMPSCHLEKKMFFEQFKFSSVDPSWFQIDGSNQWYLTALHKFHLQSTFHSRDIQFFVFLSFPLLLPVGHYFRGWSKINPKVYDVINCLNKNSVTNFVWYLEKEKRYDIEYDIWVSDK